MNERVSDWHGPYWDAAKQHSALGPHDYHMTPMYLMWDDQASWEKALLARGLGNDAWYQRQRHGWISDPFYGAQATLVTPVGRAGGSR